MVSERLCWVKQTIIRYFEQRYVYCGLLNPCTHDKWKTLFQSSGIGFCNHNVGCSKNSFTQDLRLRNPILNSFLIILDNGS